MTSTGPLLASLNAAKAMLRDCYYWRRLADPDNPWDETTAAEHIHFDGLPPADPGPDHSLSELNALRPFALIWAEQSGGLRLRSATAGNCCPLPSGVIVVQLEIPVPDALADDPTALAQDLAQKLGRIMRTADPAEPGMFELSGLSGYLPLNEIQLFGYVRSDTKAAAELGDFVVAELQLTWGMDG